uniref:Kinesin motor domain-containing protein n=1 Tax=Plectus sambesii TaxID=2011161 RepID=A0A914XCY9_9BILA
MCRVCTAVPVTGEPHVTIGADRGFTFDHVFDLPTPQATVYADCVHNLVEGIFDGFNATVLAYGQTGSGKTYSMGTGFETATVDEEVGIIPRALAHVFNGIDRRREEAKLEGRVEPVFDVSVQFIELYNEEIIDLLTEDRGASKGLRIHEDHKGEIYLQGATAAPVKNAHEIFYPLTPMWKKYAFIHVRWRNDFPLMNFKLLAKLK